jgi:hypothetical protein
MKTPDTWEVGLSAGEDKRLTFERLLVGQKLGGMALLRNLRNMQEAGVNMDIVRNAIVEMDASRILPFRFIAAAKYAPALEAEMEQAMFRSLLAMPKLAGETTLLVDVSGSMGNMLSTRSDMRRVDAASGLAVLAREICETVRIFTFSSELVEVPPRRGFALIEAIDRSQPHMSTYLGKAVSSLMQQIKSDRFIVITDEQSHDAVPDPDRTGYLLNVASNQNGVGYYAWNHVDGWSDSVIRFVQELETGKFQ